MSRSAADGVGMEPGDALDVSGASLAYERVEGWQRVSGDPTTGSAELGALGGAEFGLWEMTSGSMLDVEADEVFLVTSGTATVEFLEPEAPPVDLVPGTIVRLAAGMRTRWTVTGAPLRKFYVVAESSADTAEETR